MYQGASVLVGKEATLSMGNGATLGDEAEIICKRRISVGEFSDITWQCQVTDYNSHFIMDCNTHRVNTIFREVVLGDYCWIGNRTTIQPGTRLPDRTIVASNSLLNKDYITKGIRPYSMIGGQPAKLIKTDVMRIYNRKKESVLLEHFLNFENMEEYVNYIDKED